MNTSRKVAKNTVVLFIGNLICRILSVILIIYLARCTGNTGLGTYSFAISFTALFGMISDLGLNSLAVREVAKDAYLIPKYLGNLGIIRFFLSVIGFILPCLLISFMNRREEVKIIIYLMAGSSFFLSLSMGFRWAFQAVQKLEYEALLNVIQSILLLILGGGALFLGYKVIGFVFMNLIVSILCVLLTLFFTIKTIASPKFECDFKFLKGLFTRGIPFFLLYVIGTIYVNADNILLSTLAGDAETGWYAAAAKLTTLVKALPAYFSMALFPVLINYYNTEGPFIKTFNKSIQYMLIIAIPLAIGTTILGDKIILLLYGEKFINSIIVLKILMWAVIFSFMQHIYAFALLAINREKEVTFIWAIGLILNLSLYFLLIPIFREKGAGLTIFFSEFFITTTAIVSFGKIQKGTIPLKSQSLKIILSSVIMGGFLYILRNINLSLSICSGILIYALMLFIFKGFTKEDFELIKKIRKTQDSG